MAAILLSVTCRVSCIYSWSPSQRPRNSYIFKCIVMSLLHIRFWVLVTDPHCQQLAWLSAGIEHWASCKLQGVEFASAFHHSWSAAGFGIAGIGMCASFQLPAMWHPPVTDWKKVLLVRDHKLRWEIRLHPHPVTLSNAWNCAMPSMPWIGPRGLANLYEGRIPGLYRVLDHWGMDPPRISCANVSRAEASVCSQCNKDDLKELLLILRPTWGRTPTTQTCSDCSLTPMYQWMALGCWDPGSDDWRKTPVGQ